MKTYTAEELKVVLSKHALYLRGEAGGERAYLQRANLQGADLQRAFLRGANLQGADLRGADLQGANLQGAYLQGANLRGANLQGAYLQGADLQDANLQGADLRGADLQGANLPAFQLCPQEGAFVAWKKVRGAVLKLLVTGKRTSSLVGRKCRASEVCVFEAFSAPGETEFTSLYDPRFIYRVGETAREENYDDDIRVECTEGIHFFMTRKEAEEYT
jgi:hypothetical protein